MAKVPSVGSVKTRLVPPLTPDQAATVSGCFLRDTADNIASVAADSPCQVDGIAVYTPIEAEAELRRLLPEGFGMAPQRGESFGDRLLYAAQDLFDRGYESLCLINGDSPTLPPSLLRSAVDALCRPDERVVLGPSEDGGYYLIGLKHLHQRLFEGIDWSTSVVLAQTLDRAAELALDVELLDAWYDVDRADDLRCLCEELFGVNGGNGAAPASHAYPATHTRAYLAMLLREVGRDRIWPTGLSLGQGSRF